MATDDQLSSENFLDNDDFPDLTPPIYSLESENSKFLCIICNKPTLLCCSDCQQVFYCSAAHQKLHWKFHQSECPGGSSNGVYKPVFPHTSSLLSQKAAKNLQLPEKPPKKQSFEDKRSATNTNNNNNFNEMTTSQMKIEDLRVDKLLEEREKERKDIVLMFSQNQYSQSIIKCRRLAAISKKIFELYQEKSSSNKKNDIREFLEFCCDHFLLIRSLLKTDKIQQCRENLLLLLPIVNTYIDDSKLDYQKLKENEKNSSENNKEFKFREGFVDNITFQKRFLLNNELKKRTNLLSILASMFYAVGDYKNCELIYVKYVRLVENNFGSNTLEISNCYFLIGVFYLQHKYHSKALACFKKSLEIRLGKLGEKHESVSDCWYNMGVVYKQTNKKFKAIQYLEKALVLRKELIGEIALPCAQVLEILGKIYLEGADYRSALVKFQDCYNIRKKILNNSRHPDLIRISLLIVHLQNTIKEDLSANTNKKTQEILLSVNEQITSSNILDNDGFRSIEKDEIPYKDKEIAGLTNIREVGSTTFFKKKPGNTVNFNKELVEDLLETEVVAVKKPGIAQKPGNLKPTLKNPQENVGKLSSFGEKPREKPEKSMNYANVSPPGFELSVDKEFMASLSTDQLMKLAGLKTLLKETQRKDAENFNPNEIIMNSEFLKGLNGLQYASFVGSVKPSVELFKENLRNWKENSENHEKSQEKTEKFQGFAGLPRGKEDISGFLKLSDLKK